MTQNEIMDFLTQHNIDIAVELDEDKKTLTNFFGLKRFLEERLGKRIDLGIKSAMKPIVRKAAQEDMLYVCLLKN